VKQYDPHRLEPSFFISKSIFKSLYLSTSLMGWTRYTNLWVPDMSPMYPSFLMLHTCFYTICLVFRYTSWHFNAFSRTNLLTRCHSASSLFFAIFVSHKSYTGNILRIGRNKSQTSRYFTELPEHRRGDGEEPLVGHTTRGCGLGLARAPLW
jgi:hypothetical protein